MRNDIWKALTWAKHTQLYTEITCEYYRKASKTVNIITILFSGSGVIMGASFWKTGIVFPFVSCVIITVVQAIKAISPKLFPTDKEYKKYNAIIDFYFNQSLEFQKLWHELENEEITEKVARDRYFKLIAKEKTILETQNEMLTDDNKRRKRKAQRATEKHCSQL